MTVTNSSDNGFPIKAVAMKEDVSTAMDDEIREEINIVLHSLARREKSWHRVALIFGTVVFLVMLVFVHRWWVQDSHSHDWPLAIIAILFVAFLPAMGFGAMVFWVGCIPATIGACSSYVARFESTEERMIADQVLLSIAGRDRGIQSLGLFRRRLGVITRVFKCGACGAHVTPEHMGQIISCGHCDARLFVPVRPHCPWCSGENTCIVSPQEQVAPIRDHQATAAGSLIYGPVGIVAGLVLDAIYRPFKLVFRGAHVALKGHVFQCGDCFTKWAIKLHAPDSVAPLPEEQQDIKVEATLLRLTKLYIEMGRVDKARSLLKKGLARFPDSKDLRALDMTVKEDETA